ncbi:MAG: hypothetical protein AAF330_05920, partial [Pseudomonadota bacterium]
MEIAYHIGVHHTDDDRLIKSVMKNRETLHAQGITVPEPDVYREKLHASLFAKDRGDSMPETRHQLLRAALAGQEADRVVFSWPQFLSGPRRVLEGGELYKLTTKRTGLVTEMFAQDDVEFYVGIRNLATFVPEVFKKSGSDDFASYLRSLNFASIAWAGLSGRLRQAAPQAQIVVWCNEDTPLLWSQLIREVSGVDPLSTITGGFDLLKDIMTEEGHRRLLEYLK